MTPEQKIKELIGLLDVAMNFEKLSNEERDKLYQQFKAERQRKIARHAMKWQDLMNRMTKKCLDKVDELTRLGASINKLYTDRATGNVAAMVVRPNVWDSAKGRMGRSLYMVYPDGGAVQTFEKSISIRRSF